MGLIRVVLYPWIDQYRRKYTTHYSVVVIIQSGACGVKMHWARKEIAKIHYIIKFSFIYIPIFSMIIFMLGQKTGY